MAGTTKSSKTLRDFISLVRTGTLCARRDMLFFSRDRLARTLIMSAIASAFVTTVFFICLVVFSVLLGLPHDLGWAALQRIGEYGFGIILFMMFYSSLLTSLYVLFTDKTLDLLWASPISWVALWFSRALIVAIRSGWMVCGFSLPVLLALGVAASAPFWYYLIIPLVLLVFGILPACLGIATALVLIHFLPPKRLQQTLLLIGMVIGMTAAIGLQLMRLDTVIQDSGNLREIGREISEMRRLPPLLEKPVSAAASLLLESARGEVMTLGHLGAYVAIDTLVILLLFLLGGKLYYNAWSGRQSSSAPTFKRRYHSPVYSNVLERVPFIHSSLFAKDLTVFFRELEQWSSLVMILPLCILYIISILMIRDELRPMLAMLGYANMLISGMVVSGMGARVLFPCFSMEGKAFWNILSSPVRLSRLVLNKFVFFSIPIVGTMLVMTIIINVLFSVNLSHWFLSVYSSVVCGATICSIGVGFGAMFPRFEYRQTTQVVLSMGGLYYMLACLLYLAVMAVLWFHPFIQNLESVAVRIHPPQSLATYIWLMVGTTFSFSLVGLNLWAASSSLRKIQLAD
jgi:ABC-2 type transport system permease protein